MDNLFTKEYLEKCINNSDLQSLWKPEFSHFISNNSFDYDIVRDYKYHINKEKDFWIPRQDELQLILKQKKDRFKNMTDLKFDFNMRQCIFKTYCHKILITLSLNDMWIIFFMRELFGKQWVPESKSWEKR